MADLGKQTFDEILSQPMVWSKLLSDFALRSNELQLFLKTINFDQAIFIGCGSTYYLSMTAAALFQSLTGFPAQAHPSSQLIISPEIAFPKNRKILLVAISRSGETTETIEAVSHFKGSLNGRILAVTTEPESSLVKQADYSIICEAAREESIVQTRSFTSMLLLIEAFVGQFAGYKTSRTLATLPELNEKLFNNYHALARALGENTNIERFFFLGSGLLHGIAQEAMLKIKEMSLSNSEAFHVLEFRHGPMSMVDKQSLIVGLISEKGSLQEIKVIKEMRALNGLILTISEMLPKSLRNLDNSVELKSGIPMWARPVLYLPLLQLLGFYRAVSRGHDPDKPRNLDAVVKLKTLW